MTQNHYKKAPLLVLLLSDSGLKTLFLYASDIWLLYFPMTVTLYYCVILWMCFFMTVLFMTVLLHDCVNLWLCHLITVPLYLCVTVWLFYFIHVLFKYCVTILFCYFMICYSMTGIFNDCNLYDCIINRPGVAEAVLQKTL